VIEFVLSFLAISFLTALVAAMVRSNDRRGIWQETLRFFTALTVGIAVFCVIVIALEWIFIRPPL